MGKRLTIPMTSRRPVSIDAQDWPLIARADWHDGAEDSQANHVRKIKVRRHADGRTVVYGSLEEGPSGMHPSERPVRAGYLVDCEDDIPEAIRMVAGEIGDSALAREAIADLPAEEL